MEERQHHLNRTTVYIYTYRRGGLPTLVVIYISKESGHNCSITGWNDHHNDGSVRDSLAPPENSDVTCGKCANYFESFSHYYVEQ